MSDVRILSVPILFRWGRVNCYLLEAAGGFILVDEVDFDNAVAHKQAAKVSWC